MKSASVYVRGKFLAPAAINWPFAKSSRRWRSSTCSSRVAISAIRNSISEVESVITPLRLRNHGLLGFHRRVHVSRIIDADKLALRTAFTPLLIVLKASVDDGLAVDVDDDLRATLFFLAHDNELARVI